RRAVVRDRAGRRPPLEARDVDTDARAEQRAVVNATHRAVAEREPAIRRRDIVPNRAAQARASSHLRPPSTDSTSVFLSVGNRSAYCESPDSQDSAARTRAPPLHTFLSLISVPLTVCSRMSFDLIRVALQLTPWGVPLHVSREPPSR